MRLASPLPPLLLAALIAAARPAPSAPLPSRLPLSRLVLMAHSREAQPIVERLSRLVESHIGYTVHPDPARRPTSPLVGELLRPERLNQYRRNHLSWERNTLFGRRGLSPGDSFPVPSRNEVRHAPRISRQVGLLLNTLGELAGEDGSLELGQVERRYGRDARSLVESMMRRTERNLSLDGVPFGAILRGLDPALSRHLVTPERLIPRMAAFERLQRRLPPARLKGRVLFARQHLVGNTWGLLRATGIAPEDTILWGKPYSLDPRVGVALQQRGYRLCGTRVGPHAATIERRIRQGIEDLKRRGLDQIRGAPPFLILDDGGELIELVASIVRTKFSDHAHLFAGVEETTRGLTRLRHLQLPFPVVASAGSIAKRRYGSPMFGRAVRNQTVRTIKDLERQGLRIPRRATVIGFGPIAEAIAVEMRAAGFEVHVYDKRWTPAKQARARAAGLVVETDKATALSHGQVLVSGSGATTLTSRWLRHLPDGAILVNGASPREFDLRPGKRSEQAALRGDSQGSIWGHFQGRRLRLGEWGTRWLHRIWRSGGKEFLLARSGDVINFSVEASFARAGNIIPGRYIQHELGLLYQALLQAAQGGGTGLQDLDLAAQRRWTRVVQRELRQTGESLLRPRF